MSGSSVTRAAALEKSPQQFPFLSDDWFDAVEAFLPLLPEVSEQFQEAVVNVSVTGGPQGGHVGFHLAGGARARGSPRGRTHHHRAALQGRPGDAGSTETRKEAGDGVPVRQAAREEATSPPLLGLQSLVPDLDEPRRRARARSSPQLQAITAQDAAGEQRRTPRPVPRESRTPGSRNGPRQARPRPPTPPNGAWPATACVAPR